MIIATAGHVDHGKTELVKALTGIETDRLPEEKARGLSIDLGFAYQALANDTVLGFVDVPGHEKFIRNMLAGVGGIDLGLLVVAADDGVMPQTREHMAILDLLGIEPCVVAISKIDRVDEGRIQEVRHQVEKLLANTGHRDINIHLVCAPANRGIDALKHDLVKRAQVMDRRVINGHFRMAIDRVFSLKGVGLVVTGMVLAGTTSTDDTLVLSSNGSPVRVRGIRVHNTISERAQAGERCAINISGRGVSVDIVKRGSWLLHEHLFAPTRRIDVDLRVLDSESRALKHWTPTHLHLGTDHLAARVAVLSGGVITAGERGLAQLVLEQDAFVVHGDRFVLRDQSAQRTLAGGHVIDAFSPKRGRARPTRIEALWAMNHHDPGDALNALAGLSETGVRLTPFVISRNLTQQQVDQLIAASSLRRVGRQPQEWVYSTIQWQDLLRRIEQAIRDFHQSKPEHAGAGLREIQWALKPYIEVTVLKAAIDELLKAQRLGRRAASFHLPSHVIKIAEHDQQLWARATPYLAPDSGSPLSLHQAAEALGVDIKTLEASLKNAVKAGEMVRVAKNRYLPTVYSLRLGFAAEALAEQTEGAVFTVTGYCKYTKTGRNFAIDLLEYFDRLGLTVRVGNTRRIKHSAAAVSGVEDNV